MLDCPRPRLSQARFQQRIAVVPDLFRGFLAETYDKLFEAELKSLPEIETCDTRRELDAAVTHALGLDGETVATIRQHLASEPSVRGERYNGLEEAK